MPDISVSSTKNVFYVYVLLDPRKFYAPFYVGKGKGHRVRASLNGRRDNPFKARVLRRIRAAGLEPGVLMWSTNLTESAAFKIERDLVERFGRRHNGTGILTNLTAGGEGHSGEKNPMHGRSHTDKSREKMRKSQRARCDAGIVTKHSDEHRARLRADNPGGKATAKPIFQISLDGEVIQTWPSAQAASESLNINKGNICAQSKDGSVRICGGFWWRLTTSSEVVDGRLLNVGSLNEKRLRPNQTKKVAQKTTDGALIRVWDSFQDAANDLELGYHALWASSKHGRLYKGFFWERV